MLETLTLQNLFMYFLPTLWFFCFVTSITLSARAGWKGVSVLTILYLYSYIDGIWHDPIDHMLANLVVFCVVLFGYTSPTGIKIRYLTLLMVICNGVFAVTGWLEFYRHSVITVLFLACCYVLAREGYNTHENKGNNPGASDDSAFMAKDMVKP